VIRSDETMGRYGNDPTWKKRLLMHEGWAASDTADAGGNGGRVSPSGLVTAAAEPKRPER
jgi:hypothetical protein